MLWTLVCACFISDNQFGQKLMYVQNYNGQDPVLKPREREREWFGTSTRHGKLKSLEVLCNLVLLRLEKIFTVQQIEKGLRLGLDPQYFDFF